MSPAAATQLNGLGVGFCGKVQSHGDFVQRRLPRLLVQCWEQWLDTAIATTRERLGEDWRTLYLMSPIWRFAASAGCCGEHPFVGVLMPSLDKVGRYHPLTIIAILERPACAAAVALCSASWYRDIEAIALSALSDEFKFDEFDSRLAAAASPIGPDILPFGTGFRNAVPGRNLDYALPVLIAGIIEAHSLPYSLWWSVDAQENPECCFGYPGLPTPEDFGEFLTATTRPVPP